MDVDKRKANVAWLSVISNTTLVILKLAIGLSIGAVSVISEAIHSGVDLVAALIALFAVKSASRAADREHPYGHGKIENISGTIEALLIFGAAIWIVYEAIHKLLHPAPLDAVFWGIVVMAGSAIANYIVSGLLFKVGKETESVALEADAWHLRTDVWTSAGVMGGLVLVWAGGKLFPERDLTFIDPLVAIAVALLIVKAAWDLTQSAGKDLLDASLPLEEEAWLRQYLAQADHRLMGFHGLRTRKAGSDRFAEFHIQVTSGMPVVEAHEVAEQLEVGIRARFPQIRVLVHVEPCDGRCSEVCVQGCLQAEDARAACHAAYLEKAAQDETSA